MTIISRNNQILIYVTILIFVIFFFFYFYRQASITENDFLEVKVSGKAPEAQINNETVKIDTGIFSTEKFRNLRAEVAPIKNFETGKRNPFEAY